MANTKKVNLDPQLRHRIVCIGFAALLLGMQLVFWFLPDQAISGAERRKLEARPSLNTSAIADGSYMRALDRYFPDQFPGRDSLRTASSLLRLKLFRLRDDHGIYRYDGQLASLEEPLSEASVLNAAAKMQRLADRFFPDSRIAWAIIPEKHFYLAEKISAPRLDLEHMSAILERELPGFKSIPLTDCLQADDYYDTDIHWRQERLGFVVYRLLDAFGVQYSEDLQLPPVMQRLQPFYGSYAGRIGLPVMPDELVLLAGPQQERARIWNYETMRYQPLYQPDKINGTDGYDVFLGGASPLQSLVDPTGETGRHLVIFRDSFASSLAPLLLSGYDRITLVDLRYIAADRLAEHLEIIGPCDVLFLYSPQVLNNSTMLRD